MKVVFDKNELLAAITPAASISQVKNTFTAVDGLLFECPPDPKMGDFDGDASGMCRISAYDLEKGLRSSVKCKIFDEGKYIINGSKIMQIVRALPDGEIMIEINENLRATVSGGASSFEISVSRGEDFPAMPVFKGDRRYTFTQHVLRDMINETIFAAAQSDQKVAFNGEFLKISGGKMTLVGCDGNRLSGVTVDSDPALPECEIIIPAKFMFELSRMLHDSEDDVTMIIGSKHVIFKLDAIYFFCRMIETKYLDYNRVLPSAFAYTAYVDPADLRSALERASIISEDKLGGNNKAVVKMVFGGNKIDISAVSVSGSIFDSVPAAITGDELTIGFTCRYLLDALRAVPSEVTRIRIGLNGPDKGICIEPHYGSGFVKLENGYPTEDLHEDEEKVDFLHYIMPRHMN